jgi:hypothetical protein
VNMQPYELADICIEPEAATTSCGGLRCVKRELACDEAARFELPTISKEVAESKHFGKIIGTSSSKNDEKRT